MRRRRLSRPAIEVELFPFLSVLACTIGSLILLVVAIATQPLGSDRQVTIIAKSEEGENQAKTPRYLECREEGVLIYPSKTLVPPQQITEPDSPLVQLLTQLKERRDREYLIVVVRPQGIEVFGEVRALIEQQGIDLGYEPLEEDWQLNLEETPSQPI